MAIRIRKDGRMLCAAMFPEEPGDTYLHDGIHGLLSGSDGEISVIGSEPMERHKVTGRWYWLGNVPEGVMIDDVFYIGPYGVLSKEEDRG